MSNCHDSFSAGSTEEMCSFLVNSFVPEDLIAIVAGHFMLMYDPSLDALIPMIHQDASTDYGKRLSRSLAGDFPLSTFKNGVQIWKAAAKIVKTAKIVLAVNDHAFHSSGGFQNELASNLGTDAVSSKRSAFYRNSQILPKTFELELTEAKISPEAVICRNDNPARDKNAILPRETAFFSEKSLRNAFDRQTLKGIRNNPLFKYTPTPTLADAANYRLDYINPVSGSEVCLTESGTCGCSGEMIQFLLQLYKKHYNKIVFFVPLECKIQVIRGTQAALAHINARMTVHLIFGFGGMAGNPPGPSEDIQILTYEHA